LSGFQTWVFAAGRIDAQYRTMGSLSGSYFFITKGFQNWKLQFTESLLHATPSDKVFVGLPLLLEKN
jgi:hypothetical protein